MSQLVKFSVTDAAIAELSSKYLPLKVKGLEDKVGLAAVHEARMEVKGLRVDVEKTRKALKEESLEYGRKVDAEAKRITAELVKIESHLEAEESIVAKEKERKAAELAAKKKAILDGRLKLLADCETMANPQTVEAMSDGDFATFLSESQAKHLAKVQAEAEANRQRLAAEAAAKEEAAKLAAERAELARIKAEQEAAQKLIDDEKARLAKIESDRLRTIELEKAKAEAAEKARIETEQRIAREKAEAEAKAERDRLAAEQKAKEEEDERQRLEAMRPDIDKILKIALMVEATAKIDLGLTTDAGAILGNEIRTMLNDLAKNIRIKAEKLKGKA